MMQSVVDEFCTNEEVRVRRFGMKMADQDPRAQALIEIAERLKSLAEARGGAELTDAQWGARMLDKIIAEANQRRIGLLELLQIVAGMAGHVIACTATPDHHDKLISYAQRMMESSLRYQVEHGMPADATVQ